MLAHNKEFNNIKVHTQYSICEGAIKIDDLANYCKANKIKAIGLADSYNLCGALEFAEKISKVGTQPIIGSQINILSENQNTSNSEQENMVLTKIRYSGNETFLLDKESGVVYTTDTSNGKLFSVGEYNKNTKEIVFYN